MDPGSTRAQHDPPVRNRRPGMMARIPLPEFVLALVFFVSAVAAIETTRFGDVALLWPGNAIAAAVLIRWRNVRWLPATTGTARISGTS